MNMFKGKNVLVTGGSGFIGTNLIRKLYKLDCHITATYHSKTPQIFMPSVTFVQCDLTDKSCCHSITRNIDYVFMCAANTSGASVMEHTPLAHVTPNVAMNSYMLEAAHKNKVKKFIFLSTTTVYPLVDHALEEEDITYHLYEKYFCVGWMKLFCEKMCEMYSTKIKNPMKTVVVRPGNLYGKYDDFEWETSHVLPAIMRRVIEKHDPLEVWGDGSDIKDFLYIDDFIDGLILAAEKLDSPDPINIASGKSISVKEALQCIIEAGNFGNANVTFDTSKPTMIPKRVIDISRAEKLLGFAPKISFKKGIKLTMEWYKSNLVYA